MPSPDAGLGRNMNKWSVIGDDHETRAYFDIYAELIEGHSYGKKFLIIDMVFSLGFIKSFGVI
jgi:hypothetical protein